MTTRQIILDTETTGLEPSQGHRIIEIAAAEMINRRLTGRHFHYYINPERSIDAGAQKIHGITEKFLIDKPKFSDIADELLAYLQGGELIIHNAPFDIGFLNHEFQLLRRDLPKITDTCKVIDTLVMARQKHRGQKNNLDALCKRYQVDNSRRDLHGALIDVNLLAEVYLAMTGGQMNLFIEEPLQENTRSSSKTTSQTPNQDIPKKAFKILQASPEELAEHEKYMNMLDSDKK